MYEEPNLADYLDAMPGQRRNNNRDADSTNAITAELASYFEAEEAAPETLARGSLRGARGARGMAGQSGLRGGLGDVASVTALLTQADAKFLQIKTNATKLLAMYGPLDTPVIARIRAAIAGKGPGVYAQMGAAEFSGVVRYFLQGVAYNLSLVHALMNGPNPEAHSIEAALILTPAMGTLAAVDRLITTAQATESAIASVIRTLEGAASSLGVQLHGLSPRGLGDLGFEPVEIAAGIVIAFIVVSALYLAFSQYESMQAASAAADTACSQPGVSCTAEQWANIRDQALQAAATLSILPNLGHAIEQAGSLLFWGGMAAVAAVLAYGAWVAAPAASITRERLRAGASKLGGYRHIFWTVSNVAGQWDSYQEARAAWLKAGAPESGQAWATKTRGGETVRTEKLARD